MQGRLWGIGLVLGLVGACSSGDGSPKGALPDVGAPSIDDGLTGAVEPEPDPQPEPGPTPDVPEVVDVALDVPSEPEDTGPDLEPGQCFADQHCVGFIGEQGDPPNLCVSYLCDLDAPEAEGLEEGMGFCKLGAKPGCCVLDAQCAPEVELGPCKLPACVDNQCTVKEKAGCCFTDADCNPFSDGCCTLASCGSDNTCHITALADCCKVDTDCGIGAVCEEVCVEDGCTVPPVACDKDVVYFHHDFDTGLVSLDVWDANGTDAVGAQSLAAESASPHHSLYLGDPACRSYYTGPMEGCVPTDPFANESYSVELRVTSDAFSIPLDAPSWAGFWLNMAAEPALALDLGEGPVVLDTDVLVLEAIVAGEIFVVWRSTDPDALGLQNTTGGGWRYMAANLQLFQGQSVTLRLRFTTDGLDDYNNAPGGDPWYGVYVDDLKASTLCFDSFCTTNSDCKDDDDACTEDTCTPFAVGGGGVCAAQTSTPGEACIACVTEKDCGSDPCLHHTCAGGQCESTLKEECCQPQGVHPHSPIPGVVELEGFESGAEGSFSGWTVVDPWPDDSVSWQLHDVLPHSGETTLYFGDPLTETYVSSEGVPAEATAFTPWFPLGGELMTHPILSFWLWLSTEYDGALLPPSPDEPYDTLRVVVESLDAVTSDEVWRSTHPSLGGSTFGGWKQVGVPLDAWIGHTIRVGFVFDSVDAAGNDAGGVRIDDLGVLRVCETECSGFADCNDGDLCSSDWCDLGACAHEVPDPTCCVSLADCDDANGCTLDACDEGHCVHEYDSGKLDSCCSEGPWIGSWKADFEGGAQGFKAFTDSPPVGWHLSSDESHSGSASFTASDPATGLYDAGDLPVNTWLVSPPTHVPPFSLGTPYAEFWVLLETEWDTNDLLGFDTSGLFTIDDLSVAVAVDGALSAAEEHWVSHYLSNTTGGLWVKSRVDLGDYRGESVQLMFVFESGDAYKNGFRGPFLDDVSFGTSCKALGAVDCVYGGDCEPSDACKLAGCSESFTCTEGPVPVPECCEPSVIEGLTQGFEGETLGDGGWEALSCTPGGSILVDEASVWQSGDAGSAAGINPKCGQGLLYFGNGTNIGGQAASCGHAWSPELPLEEGVPWQLDLWAWLDIETLAPPEGCFGGGPSFSDVFELSVVDVDTGSEVKLFDKSLHACSEFDKWVKHSLDMSPWAGKTIRFHAFFNSWDGISNEGKGIALDCFELSKGCAEP